MAHEPGAFAALTGGDLIIGYPNGLTAGQLSDFLTQLPRETPIRCWSPDEHHEASRLAYITTDHPDAPWIEIS